MTLSRLCSIPKMCPNSWPGVKLPKMHDLMANPMGKVGEPIKALPHADVLVDVIKRLVSADLRVVDTAVPTEMSYFHAYAGKVHVHTRTYMYVPCQFWNACSCWELLSGNSWTGAFFRQKSDAVISVLELEYPWLISDIIWLISIGKSVVGLVNRFSYS